MARGNSIDCETQYRWQITLLVLIALLIIIAVACGRDSATSGSVATELKLDEVQRRIAMLPCPPGVSAELWNVLTGELMSQLEKRASAQPLLAGPPLDELSMVDDLTVTEPTLGNIRFRWTYRNTGDYDQNSETNISDLTPVGLHFNKTPASGDWNNASVADGDLNHEVNISDVTPIGRCFLQTVTEYRVEYNASGAPGSEFTLFGSAEFDTGNPNANDWLVFEVTLPGAQSGYYRIVPYYYEERGIPSAPVYFGANQPPTAVLTADPQSGRTPMVVSFDASDSSDPEHTALTFSWDWEGDGVYDFDSGSTAALEHEYTEEGDYMPCVRVRDAKGAEAAAELRIVSHNWSIYDLDPSIGSANEATMINGKPAFTYARRDTDPAHDPGDPQILCYARSKVAVPKSPEDWEFSDLRPTELEVDYWITTYMGFPELFELDRRPAVFHWIGEPRFEYYLAHATVTEPSGPEDWIITKVSDSGNGLFGTYAGVAVVEDMPYVVHMVCDAPKLMLARGLGAEPQGPQDWNTTEILEWGGSEDLNPGPISVGYFGERISVAYKQLPDRDLAFAYCGIPSPAGPGDWRVTILDTAGNSGNTVCMRTLDGCPLISSCWRTDDNEPAVRLARALSPMPETLADWVLSSPLSGDDYAYVPMVVTDHGPVIMTTQKRENGYRQLLALYPTGPGLLALDQPWTAEAVNPEVVEDHSGYQQLLFNNGWLICIYTDSVYLPGEVAYLKCAVANMPARYVP